MEIDRGRNRPDKEAKDQRDARQNPPIDLVGFRRIKEERDPDYVSPETEREVLGILREYMDTIELPETDMDKLIARMRAEPLCLGKVRHPNSIIEEPAIDIPLNQNRKTIVDFQAHKERRQRQELPPPQNKE
jgi:hypothetical protein